MGKEDNSLEITNQQVSKFDDFTNLTEMNEFAATLVKSGMLPTSFRTPESVIATIIQGKELGLKPMTALQNLYFISGKPTLGINAIQALLRSSGIESQVLKDCEPFKNQEGKIVDYITLIKFFRKSKVTGTILEENAYYKYSEAASAGLTSKDNWKKHLRQMMYARCYALGARRVAGDILLGVYETTEMADSTNTNYTLDDEGVVKIVG